MTIRNTASGWGLGARVLHWAMAGVIFFLLGLGIYMSDFVTDVYVQFGLVQTHKSWGFVAFTLVLLRLVWRAVNRAPQPLPGPAWQERVARLAHVALYVLMVAMPVTGWLMASASPLQDDYGIKNMVFGLFVLPDPFVPGSKALADVFSALHELCAWGLIGLVGLHAGAALKHHLIDRDTVLRRMVVGR